MKETPHEESAEERFTRNRNQRASEITRRLGISAPLDSGETTAPTTRVDAIGFGNQITTS